MFLVGGNNPIWIRAEGSVAPVPAISNLLPELDPPTWVNVDVPHQYCWLKSKLTPCGTYNPPRA